jgi:hypothetical protein
VALEQRPYGDGEATGLIAAVTVGNRDPIRYDYQPRQYRSSQLRDSRMAVRISPAIE